VVEQPANLSHAHLRVARPTSSLPSLIRFYRDGLGFEVLYEFHDHQGFDGVMLGHPSAPWHLEFTSHVNHDPGRVPSQDHLLVFYLPDREEWQAAVDRLHSSGYPSVPPFNPYWLENGQTFEDPDGYRIVLQNTAWPA